ncbi:MAG: hypothetical protein R3338_14850, partial [Thermoanaerobaculia bacterium]|nr:hypothetical protein [Thermoanaerobaculia bacterium]
CELEAPELSDPAPGETVSSPVSFSWTAVPGATAYELFVGEAGGEPVSMLVTSDTTASIPLDEGDYEWSVTASSDSCPPSTSETRSFTVFEGQPCPSLGAVVVSVPGEVNSLETYTVRWTAVAGAEGYEIQESNDEGFLDATTNVETSLSRQFEQSVPEPTPFFYRVRALCGENAGPYSEPARIVVVPKPDPGDPVVLTTEFGNAELIETRVFVAFPEEAFPDQESVSFVARTDRPWLRVIPEVGVITTEGFTFDIIINPSGLPVGTSTGTLIVEFSLAGKTASNGSTTSSTPISVTLVTPVSSGERSMPPPDDALIIPAVARAEGLNSAWQSNIRLTNTSASTVVYDVTFVESGVTDSTSGKQTTIEALPGQTVALDDIVRQWFGKGSLGDGVVGVLEIRPENTGKRASQVTTSLVSVASSRTFNTTTIGTLGQFIPAIPFAQFIGGAVDGGTAPVIGLMQIEESERARTNFGLVEAGGGPATVEMRVIDDAGELLETFEIELGPGDHRQLNGFLAQNGIMLEAGRAELEVIDGNGRITGYASVVDNLTGDPIFVAGEGQTGVSALRYVL